MATGRKRPILIIPGLFGSVLRRSDTNAEVWPNSSRFGIFGPDLGAIRDLNVSIEPTDLIWKVSLQPFYETIKKLFDPEILPYGGQNYDDSQARLFAFPYDWRLDLRGTAAALAKALNQLESSHEGLCPNLISHSMGGLVVRYCLESGDFYHSKIPVNQIVFAGVPHRGAPDTILAIDGQRGAWGLSAKAVQDLIRRPGITGPRQLLPHPGQAVVLRDSLAFQVVDIYDASVWVDRLNLNIGMLSEVREFVDKIRSERMFTLGVESSQACCLIGVSHTTATHVWLREMEQMGRWFRPTYVPDAGDGVVPSTSADLNGCLGFNVSREHKVVYQDPRAENIIVRMMEPNPGRPHWNWRRRTGLSLIAKFLDSPGYETGEATLGQPALDITLEDPIVPKGRSVCGFVAPSPNDPHTFGKFENKAFKIQACRLVSDEKGEMAQWEVVHAGFLSWEEPRLPKLEDRFRLAFVIPAEVFKEEGTYEILVAHANSVTARQLNLWARERVLIHTIVEEQ